MLKVRKRALNALFITMCKAAGSLLFSLTLVARYGEEIHSQIIKEMSLFIGLGLLSRFGSDQLFLKYGSLFYKNREGQSLFQLSKFILFSVLVSTIISLQCLFFYRLEIFPLYFGISFVWVLPSLSLLSIALKIVDCPEYSPLSEVGFVLLLSSAAIIFLDPKIDFIPVIMIGATLAVLICSLLVFLNNFEIHEAMDGRSSLPAKTELLSRMSGYFLNSSFTYFHSWGIIILAGVFISDAAALSSFVIVLRAMLLFSIILLLITSFLEKDIYPTYLSEGGSGLSFFFERYKTVYLKASAVCFMGLLSLYWFASFFDFRLIAPIVPSDVWLLSAAWAFHLATGPAAMCLSTIGSEYSMLMIRILTVSTFVICLFSLNVDSFTLSFSLYFILQKVMLLSVLKKRHQVSISYLI